MGYTSPVLCFTSLLACGLLQIPTAIVFHLIPFSLVLGERKLKAYAWARARNQQWITVSEHNRRTLIEAFQMPPEAIRCIYNGTTVMPTSMSPASKLAALRSQVRRDLGVPEGSQILLTVARLASQKGHRHLIPVIPAIIQEFPTVRFVWAGDGEQRGWLMNQVREYGVADQVLFLGHRTDVSNLLQAADLFVFPTDFEGFPFALLEAMSQGLPVVASNVGSIPEIIVDQVHGLLFQPGNSTALLETLRGALQFPEQMAAIAKNAQQRVQNFSKERMITETLDVLQQLSCAHHHF